MGLLQSSEQHKASELSMAGPVATFVRATIADNKVVIFSKTYCSYSDLAKKVSVFKRGALALEKHN